ncbi:MAG TPA: PAS domain S-box protein, partial [Pyrinomonadaceae bacterium]|nr:PAS domain S-box protein [Pyrinomonadaceae bacterium]
MPEEAPVDSLPADEPGANVESPLSPDVAAYWLAALIDSADDAIITKTLDGRITSWNPGARRLFGYTAEEAIGQPVTMLIPEDHPDEEPDILARIRRGERVEHYETVRRRKDGTLVDISLTISPIRKPDGAIIGASTIARDITGRKRAEEALRRREEELTDFIDNSAVGLHWVAADGTILWANQAELDLLGYAREEYVGRHIAEFHADREAIEDILARLTRDETLHSYEARLRRKDGSIRHVLISSNVRRRDGEFVHTRCFTRDITERKRAEAELRATEHRFTMFMENLPGLAWIKDLEGRYVYANEAAVRAFGVGRTELYGKTDGEVFPPETAAQFRENDRRALEGGAGALAVEVLEQADGTHYSLVSKFPILGPEGGRLMVGGVAVDITEQKKAEEALRSSEARLRALFAAMTDVVFVLGADGRYLEIAPTDPRLLYRPPDEVLGRTLHEVLPAEQADFFLSHVRRALETRQTHTVEYQLRIGAEEVWFEGRVSPMTEGAVFWIARDVSERKRAEVERERLLAGEKKARAAAEEASRLKDEFLATVSHELRTPLTAILGWAHMLRTGQLDANLAAGAFDKIERNARAQAQLIDDLLDVSRAISGKLRLDVRPVDPNSFIEAAVEAVRPGAEAKGVRVQKVIDTGLVTVSGDPVRLQQVVWNLLSNAVKFTPRGGRIQVKLERVSSHVEIAVSDTGAGIDPEFLPYVFDRFRQADGTTTRAHGGLGLGLSIVRHIVELHGGTVMAESAGEGQGATFTVLLPVAPVYAPERSEGRVRPAARDTPPAFDRPERLDGLRVLVVDDEPDTLGMLKAGLGRCGAEVATAGSATEALAMLSESPPDLLISDIGMPDEDGYALIRKVRALAAERGGRVPAIALTAYARAEDRLQALQAGYQMHVAKPVELTELAAVAA